MVTKKMGNTLIQCMGLGLPMMVEVGGGKVQIHGGSIYMVFPDDCGFHIAIRPEYAQFVIMDTKAGHIEASFMIVPESAKELRSLFRDHEISHCLDIL